LKKPLRAILRPIEPLSFDDLPLGGEWTTRRRTISDSEIALFAGISVISRPFRSNRATARLAWRPHPDRGGGCRPGHDRHAGPPGRGVEWLNWKFPKAVHAGDTIYARWTLTQKRPPVGGAPSSIVVWRVDVHTADGALCAEGEVGARVRRQAGARDRERPAEPAATSTGAAAAPRRRRRRRPAGANGPLPETAPIAAPAAQPSNRNAPPAPPGAAAGDPDRRAPPRQRRTTERPWRARCLPRTTAQRGARRQDPSLTRRLEQSHPAPAPDLKN